MRTRFSAKHWLPAALCALFLAANSLSQDELDTRRSQIAGMDEGEKQQLLRKAERFSALASTEQARLRKLHAELEQDPQHAPELRQTLVRYNEWLATLSPGQRAELLELAPDARVAKIKQLQQDQASKLAREKGLDPRDMKQILAWLGDLSWEHREPLLATLPTQRRERLEKDEKQLRRMLVFMEWQRMQQPREAGPVVTPEEQQQLVDKLSPKTREQLDKVTDPAQQQKVLLSWLQTALRHQWDAPGSGRHMPAIAQEELERFFEKDLSTEEREKLLNLPPDAMQRELRKKYFQHSEHAAGFGPPEWHKGKSFRPGSRGRGSHRDGPRVEGSSGGGGPRGDGPRKDGPRDDDRGPDHPAKPGDDQDLSVPGTE